MNTILKNIIFDVGNVILRFNRDYLLSNFYQGDEYEFMKSVVFKDWEKLDEDAISQKDYNERVKNGLPPHLQDPAARLLDTWEDYMRLNEGVKDYIVELKKKGYKLFVLSNMTKHFIERIYKFPFFDLFDGIIFSAEIKMIKPNPDIYEYMIKKFDIIPEESLFIDDNKENLTTAARFKINTFLFKDNLEELKAFVNTLSKN